MRPGFSALLALTAASLISLPGGAAEVTVTPGAGGTRLLVGGKLITTFRTSNGSLSAEQRAQRAAERLEDLIPKGLKPADVSVRARPDGSWGVYVSGGILMIATAEEAALRKETPEGTARLWATNLKAALGGGQADKAPTGKSPGGKPGANATSGTKPAATPVPAKPTAAKPAGMKSAPNAVAAKPTVKPAPKPAPEEEPTLGVRLTDLAVPLGETRSLNVRGTAKGTVSVRVEGEAVAAKVLRGGELIELRGLAPGKAIVRVARDGQETAFTAWVKKYAGIVAETPTAMVTGTLTPGSLVKKVAAEKALDGVRREPGTKVEITGPAEGVRALARGQSTSVRFPITISGAGLLERKTYSVVKVDNLPLQPEPAKVLLYSNDPESVREYGTLFEGMIGDEGPARLMFHHQNRMGRQFAFEIHLLNPNRTPVDVQVIEADAGPVLDTIQVGHRAAERYMSATSQDVGYILTIPPRKSRTVYATQVPNILTVSGLYNFRILDGGPLIAHVSASPEFSLPEVTDDLVQAAESEPDTYPHPQKDETYKYAVGDRWTFIPLGRKAIPGKTPNKKLFGNYGVIYNLTVDLQNPTDEEKTVTVRLAAEAGWTRGVFTFDGKLVEAPQIAPPGEAVLWSVKLAPQEHRVVKIQGIPVGGSAYPVSLVVRS